jgi:phage shock protein A
MGLLNRIGTVIQAKMSKIVDKAEDPRETLDYSYEKQLELLQNVKRGVAEVATAKTRLQLQKDKLTQNIQKLESQARDAVHANREDLARLALERKNAISSQIAGLDQQIADLETQQTKLVASEQRLSTKIEVFRTKKETIKAEYSAAEATVRINESVSGISEEMADIGTAIERAENKTDEMKARGHSRISPAAGMTLTVSLPKSARRAALNPNLPDSKRRHRNDHTNHGGRAV